MVNVSFTHRQPGSPELVRFEKINISYQEACSVIDDYPLASELELFEKHGEGGGITFISGDPEIQYAYYQFVPFATNEWLLDLDIVLKKGFLGIFGNKSISTHYDLFSISEVKDKIRELFDYSLSALYEKYKENPYPRS